MLNELLMVERGARQAGVEMAQRHPDVKDARRVPTLLVRLGVDGHVVSVRPVPPEVTPWTLRDGQHNSFPFIQPKQPLWLTREDDERRRKALDRKNAGRREALFALAGDANVNEPAFGDWPGDGLINRVRERRRQLASLDGTEATAVPASMDRFVAACDPSAGGNPHLLLREVAEKLLADLRESPGRDWVDVAVAVLVEGGGAFMFDAAGDWPSVLDAKVVGRVSVALRSQQTSGSKSEGNHCGLTGEVGPLVESKFPQPNLPLLGQTYLFSRNKDARANDRYGKFSADSMPVSQDAVIRLAAAAEALTTDERRNVTWRPIPGEAPKQGDLLLAFVEEVPEAPAAAALAEDDTDEDFAEEAPRAEGSDAGSSVDEFEKRAERLVDTVRAKVGADLRNTRVRLAVLRKVDPANRKVVYAGQPSVADLYDAATRWVAGERNVPPWLALRVRRKGERNPRPMHPPHVAPLGVISFSRQLYVRGGAERQEVVGLSAAEAMALFLEGDRRRVWRIMRLVLTRRTMLMAGVAHARRRRADRKDEFDLRREALRTVTVLGVLLHKLGGTGNTTEDYMTGTAFKLGQLLAAADIVHAGYCADVRGGDVPPSLLGNQVFAMAQTAPQKALAVLCRRWKPYDGWAKKASRERGRADALVASKKPDEIQRGWEIKKALRHAREMRPLADELGPALSGCTLNDQFRAELLLGYIAGLPKAQKDETADGDQDTLVN